MRMQRFAKYVSKFFEPTRVFIALMIAVTAWLFPFISFKEKTITPIEHGVIVSADPFTAGAIGECADVHCEPGFCCVKGYCKTGGDNCGSGDPPPSPPTISASLNCSVPGNNGWCKGSLSLDLSASDPQGQSVVISGTINADNFACPSGATSCNFPISGEGTGSITYRVDSATGLSVAGSTGYQIDVSTPNLNASVSGAAGTPPWYVSNATLSASGSDSISGLATIETNTDSGGWIPYGGPLTLTDGIHTVSVRAIDNAGNVSQTSRTIQVDTITPSLSFSKSGTSGKNGWYVSDASATPNASDAGSGIAAIEASVDGGGWSAVGSLSFTDGEHTYKFRAIDHAGNITETPMQYVNVDTTPPSIEMSQGTSLGDEVKYKIEDDGSGLSIYRAIIEDNGAQYQKAVWTGNISGKIIQSKILWDGNFGDNQAGVGEYMITMKVTDAAGNQAIATSYVSVNLLSFLQDVSDSTPADSSVVEEEESSASLPSVDEPVTFGGIQVTTNIGEYVTTDMSVASTTIPFTNIPLDPNILWGAAATAMVGATLADWARQREEERRRKEEELRRRAEEGGGNITARRLGLKAQEDAVRNRWAQQKAEKERQASYNQHMEDKMTKLDAIEDAKWTASQAILAQREKEKDKAAYDHRMDEHTGEQAKVDAWKVQQADAARWAGLAAMDTEKGKENKPLWRESVDYAIGGLQTAINTYGLRGINVKPLETGRVSLSASSLPEGTRAAYFTNLAKNEEFIFRPGPYLSSTIESKAVQGFFKNASSAGSWITAGLTSFGLNLYDFGKGHTSSWNDFSDATVEKQEFWVSTGVDTVLNVAVGVAAVALVVATAPAALPFAATAALVGLTAIGISLFINAIHAPDVAKNIINPFIDALQTPTIPKPAQEPIPAPSAAPIIPSSTPSPTVQPPAKTSDATPLIEVAHVPQPPSVPIETPRP